jgi:hypothetical protein
MAEENRFKERYQAGNTPWVWGQPNYERIVRGKRVALFCSE